jgi:hypothetical protein
MSYSDAVARIAQIQSQIASLSGAFQPAAAPAATAPAPTSGSGSFASALASAQGTGGVAGASDVAGSGVLPGGSSALPVGSGTLPAGASSQLTTAQQAFASRLAADTGLDAGVVSAWLLAEESGGAAQSRQAQNNNDWLNIGYTDSGTYGAADSVWSDPVAAADATAGWLKGQNTIPGYGTASAGIQGILQTVGQGPAAQIAALQSSGWASGGYPSLPALYAQVTA